jgi:hypothetical protein
MNTKILAVPLVLLALGCRDQYEGQAGAASTPAPAATPYGSEGMAAPATTGAAVTAVVVSVDAAASTITLREATAAGAPTGEAAGRPYNVSSAASAGLGALQAGDRVNVICETTPGGTATGATGGGALVDCVTITTIAEAGGATGQ